MPIMIDIRDNPFLYEIVTRGLREGREEGRTEAKAETLLHQIERRFGRVPATIRDRVTAADLASLDLWLDRIIDAPNLDAVFAPPPSPT